MRVRGAAVVLATAILAACEGRRAIGLEAVPVGPAPVVVRPDAPLRAPGPQHELCFEVVAPTDAATGRPGPTPTYFAVVLLTAGGGRDTLDARSTTSDAAGLCAWRHIAPDRARAYDRIELRADRPAEFRRLRWWSGKRSL